MADTRDVRQLIDRCLEAAIARLNQVARQLPAQQLLEKELSELKLSTSILSEAIDYPKGTLYQTVMSIWHGFLGIELHEVIIDEDVNSSEIVDTINNLIEIYSPTEIRWDKEDYKSFDDFYEIDCGWFEEMAERITNTDKPPVMSDELITELTMIALTYHRDPDYEVSPPNPY